MACIEIMISHYLYASQGTIRDLCAFPAAGENDAPHHHRHRHRHAHGPRQHRLREREAPAAAVGRDQASNLPERGGHKTEGHHRPAGGPHLKVGEGSPQRDEPGTADRR